VPASRTRHHMNRERAHIAGKRNSKDGRAGTHRRRMANKRNVTCWIVCWAVLFGFARLPESDGRHTHTHRFGGARIVLFFSVVCLLVSLNCRRMYPLCVAPSQRKRVETTSRTRLCCFLLPRPCVSTLSFILDLCVPFAKNFVVFVSFCVTKRDENTCQKGRSLGACWVCREAVPHAVPCGAYFCVDCVI